MRGRRGTIEWWRKAGEGAREACVDPGLCDGALFPGLWFRQSVVIALDDRAIDDDVVRAVSGTSWGELKATSPGAARLVLEYLIAAGPVTLLLGPAGSALFLS